MQIPPQACLLIVAPLCLSASGVTQTNLVVPPRFATAEAESFTGFPFGRSGPVRAQHYYGPGLFPGPRTITAFAFRPDGSKALAAKRLDVEMFIGPGPMEPGDVQNDFHKNRRPGFQLSFFRRIVSLPAQLSAKGPRPFDVSLTLDRSFVYDPKKGGLLIEIVVHAQQPGRYEVDLGLRCTSRRANYGRPGCKGSNGRAPTADCPTTSLLWGQPFVMRVRNLLPRAATLLMVGTQESGLWGGLTLPFPLDKFGAPGCALNNDIFFAIADVATTAGEILSKARLPASASLTGHWFRFQAMSLDVKANKLGLTTSNGSKTEICGPNPMARVLATSLLAATGVVEVGVSPVTRFTVK